MIFRKDALLFYQTEMVCIVVMILCLGLIPTLGVGLTLLYACPFLVLMLANPQIYKEFITINESGISCHKSGKQLWSYEWNGIAELRNSSRFRMPSIEVIAYKKCGEGEAFAVPNHYFQLGRKAKKAIKQYYNPMRNLSDQ